MTYQFNSGAAKRDNDQLDVYKTTAGQQCFQTSEILVSYSYILSSFFFNFMMRPSAPWRPPACRPLC